MALFSPRQLDVFISIARLGSVKAAADVLHLTQPAASMALAELEKQLGAPLFDRDKGRLYLNETGRRLLPLAQEIIERMIEFRQRADDQADILTGEFRIGASNTVGNYRVGDLLSNFVLNNDRVTVHLTVANTDEIVRQIVDHTIDVACVEGQVHHEAVESMHWMDDSLCVCTRPDHPLAAIDRLQPADFLDARWILRERGSATRAVSDIELDKLPQAKVVMELGQIEAIKQAVIAGLGIAFLPEVAVTHAVSSGRLALLDTPFLNLTRQLSIIYHRSRYQGRLMRSFLDSVNRDARKASA
ncbi:transcriptional regulator [Advenella kashmirensis W13003]|uniref:Transcriptional regulator n=1 Tax=Advenella kashmirensis W13003 TaxID=1424334 RepID=V8QP23_9BURK|nr:LysR substrate-binding domain-containing protein [Advenella kashmirensis]ETF01721.1 transcriptional regulator [Advenella kashmirensis W13003]